MDNDENIDFDVIKLNIPKHTKQAFCIQNINRLQNNKVFQTQER